jgi:hypothetical protein
MEINSLVSFDICIIVVIALHPKSLHSKTASLLDVSENAYLSLYDCSISSSTVIDKFFIAII